MFNDDQLAVAAQVRAAIDDLARRCSQNRLAGTAADINTLGVTALVKASEHFACGWPRPCDACNSCSRCWRCDNGFGSRGSSRCYYRFGSFWRCGCGRRRSSWRHWLRLRYRFWLHDGRVQG